MNTGGLAVLVGGSKIKGASLGDTKPAHVRSRAVLVITGMALFAIGFVITINSLPRSSGLLGSFEESHATHASSTLLLVGFIISLAGLCLATVAPAILFVRARRAKG